MRGSQLGVRARTRRGVRASFSLRESSRGAHFREDLPEPGDLETSCHARVSATGDEIDLEMVPASFDIVRPGTSLITGDGGQPPKTPAQGFSR